MNDKDKTPNELTMATKKEKATGTKKKLLIVIGAVVLVMILLFGASYAIDAYYKSRENVQKPIDFDFYPADYSENIYDDQAYNDLIKDGFISYTDGASGVTIGTSLDSVQKYGSDVKFMVDYIYSIINGDADAYNAFFSESYIKANGKLEKFTMQKLYDVNITKLTSEEVSGKNGTYTKYEFILEYKILKNNGTFRNDIGDGSKKQYITITTESGKLLIDSITTAKYAVKK